MDRAHVVRAAAAEAMQAEAARLAWRFGLTYLSQEGVTKLATLIAEVRRAERQLARSELVHSVFEAGAPAA